ncbi:MAG TPA: DoxX family protein [Candidatus Tyrphobacter sp.]
MVTGVSIGVLIARLLVGGSLFAHGSQKLFGWFGGHGPAGTGGFFEQLGFRPGALFAVAAGLGESIGGLLTLLGFGGATGPALIILVMLVAIFSVHIQKGFFAAGGGWELPGMNIAASLAIAFLGNGAYALDRVLGLNFLTDPRQVWIALGCAVVLAMLNLTVRRRPVT